MALFDSSQRESCFLKFFRLGVWVGGEVRPSRGYVFGFKVSKAVKEREREREREREICVCIYIYVYRVKGWKLMQLSNYS